MAFPSIAGTVATTSVTTAATSLTLNLPGSIVAGETVIIFARFAVAGASTPTGFTGFTTLVDDTSDASDDRTMVLYKKGDGSEPGSLSLTAASSTKLAAIAFRVQDGADPTVTAPESALGTGTSASITTSTVTPTGGAKDYLFIALGGKEGEDGATFSFISGSYTTLNSGNSVNTGTGGAVATNCGVYGGSKQLNATNSGAGTISISGAASDDYTGITVAIHPAPPAVPRPRPPAALQTQSTYRAATI